MNSVFNQDKVIHAILILTITFIVIFIIGIIGYKHIFHMGTTDAFFNTSLTLSNLAIDLHEKTEAEKIFTGIYSLIAGIFFIALVSAIVAYIFTLYLET
jgi:hypothetical protein